MRRYWYKKLLSVFGPRPPVNWLLVSVVSVFVLIALLQSSFSSSFDLMASASTRDLLINDRKLKQSATSDYLELWSISSNGNRLKDVDLCGKGKEYYVPCYNVSANLLAGFKDGEELDRHCEVSRGQQHCLIRPPKDYKIPLSWPIGRDIIWSGNVKLSQDQILSSGSMTKRLMLLEENQISFQSEEGSVVGGMNDYSRLIAKLIGLRSEYELPESGVRSVLDIGCGFGSFGVHLLSLNMMAVCMAAFGLTGGQVQVALERGLPAILGNFISKQLPFPSLSYDMIHCAQCNIVWDDKGGLFLIEIDRVLKPGGYVVLTSPATTQQGSATTAKKRQIGNPVEDFSKKLCWNLLAQEEDVSIWQKTADAQCYTSRKLAIPLCEGEDVQSYYRPLAHCISGTNSKRWVPVDRSNSMNTINLEIHGVHPDDFSDDMEFWRSAVINYWSLLSPLIFSDHPKRPGDEDPLPPYNMMRNVMDMNAHYGGLNAALLESGKSVSVMNVVPTNTPNKLPLILNRGFAGVLHDWCESFPTYPRIYDMLHAKGLLSHLTLQRCSIIDLFFEMDRILRPEGWVIISDKVRHVEHGRTLALQIRWEARVIDPENGSDQRLLICQKPFIRK